VTVCVCGVCVSVPSFVREGGAGYGRSLVRPTAPDRQNNFTISVLCPVAVSTNLLPSTWPCASQPFSGILLACRVYRAALPTGTRRHLFAVMQLACTLMPWHRSAILASDHGSAAILETLRAQLLTIMTCLPLAPETPAHSVTTRGRHMQSMPNSTLIYYFVCH
jgi:hypothetical protein